MEEFDLKIFAERLKNVAQKDFGGIGELAKKLNNDNLSVYTSQKTPREPKAKFLYKLAEQNIDINKLLTGKSYVNEAILERLDSIEKKFEERITNLEAENYRYIKLVEEKENKIAELEGQLLVRFALAGELEKKLKK